LGAFSKEWKISLGLEKQTYSGAERYIKSGRVLSSSVFWNLPNPGFAVGIKRCEGWLLREEWRQIGKCWAPNRGKIGAGHFLKAE
jgi:hypothetical protein